MLNVSDLIESVMKNESKKVKELLDRGVDPNAFEDDAKYTPLHIAISFRAVDVIPMLLAAGADMHSANDEGQTPLERARLTNDRRILTLLENFTITH